MLEGPCLNHGYPIKHTLKDCGLMRKFLVGGSKKGEPKKPDPSSDDAKFEDAVYPTETACLMIFDGYDSYASRHQQKLKRREVYNVKPATPTFLKWSGSRITFDRTDHPKHVLMDGGSGLNIIYVDTLDAMGISHSCI